jgi:thymidine kinase
MGERKREDMEIIIGGCQSGKTSELIERCARKGGYIVCMNRPEAERVFAMAKKMELGIPFPITFDELLNDRHHSTGVHKFHIDEADELLRYICRGIELATITISPHDKMITHLRPKES